MRYYVIIAIVLLLSSCQSTKSISQSHKSEGSINSVNTDITSSSHDAALTKSLNLVLDSLDIWIYDYPVISDQGDERPLSRDTDLLKRAIHVSAKKASLDKSESNEIHSAVDSLSTSALSAHSEDSESADIKADSTAVAKPVKTTWILIICILATIFITSIYKVFKH